MAISTQLTSMMYIHDVHIIFVGSEMTPSASDIVSSHNVIIIFGPMGYTYNKIKPRYIVCYVIY